MKLKILSSTLKNYSELNKIEKIPSKMVFCRKPPQFIINLGGFRACSEIATISNRLLQFPTFQSSHLKNKSQASLEFLTTYGWAFLIIIITVGTLDYLGVINTKKTIPDRCVMGSEIKCLDAKIGKTDSGSATVIIKLKNNIEKPITVNSLQMESESRIQFFCNEKPPAVNWSFGEVKYFELNDCKNSDARLILGEQTKIYVKMSYYLEKSSSDFSKYVQGEIFSTVKTVQTGCSDGIDNDRNGCTDYYGGDTGCSSPNDTTESAGICPNAGGLGLNLYCFTSVYCPNTVLFKVSAIKDAHAEILTLADYDYKLCCRSATDLLTSSCVSPQVIPLHLSANTDAHVEKNTQSNYNINVCLSANTKTASCRYSTANCLADETCLATISSETDANIGDCVTQPFTNKICCKLS